MKINFSTSKQKRHQKRKEKFLLFPLFHNNSMYWLETVQIKKSYNGKNYIVTDIKRLTKSFKSQNKTATKTLDQYNRVEERNKLKVV